MNTKSSRFRLPRVPGRPTLRRLAVDEDGAAYTLSYVMVIPVYALFICMMIESVLFLTAKLGTVYASFAAARTASVWSSATTWEKAMEKSQLAAVRSMTPFSSGTHGEWDKALSSEGVAYGLAYEAYASKRISVKYLANKYGYAQSHTKVEIEGPPEHWDSPITAKVTYEFPFNIPGIGRIFGQRGLDGKYYLPITTEATIPNEAPQDDRPTIGIGYGTLE